MKRIVASGTAAAVLVMLLMSCASNPSDSSSGQQNQNLVTLVTQVSAEVSELRHLTFKRPVKIAVISQAQYAQQTAGEIQSAYTSTELTALTKEYAQMGLLPDNGTHLDSILTDFYAGFPAAYYVPGTDSVYLVSEELTDDRLTRIYVAHELTHALQDQNLGLWPAVFPAYSYYNSDSRYAQRSLIEGDASMTQILYYAQYMQQISDPFPQMQQWVASDKQGILSGSDSMGSPMFMMVRNRSPYYIGAAFNAARCPSAQKWDSINVLYSVGRAPRTTAQITTGSADTVHYYEFQRISAMLAGSSPDIIFADDDNMGFFMLLGMFYGDLEYSRTQRALDWRGDRYVFIMRNGQSYGTLVWAVSLANADAAQYLGTKLSDRVKYMRLDNATPFYSVTPQVANDTTAKAITTTWTSSLFDVKIVVTGNEVWMVQNAGSQTQSVLDELKRLRTMPTAAKGMGTTALPGTLSSEGKQRVVAGVLGRLIQKK